MRRSVSGTVVAGPAVLLGIEVHHVVVAVAVGKPADPDVAGDEPAGRPVEVRRHHVPLQHLSDRIPGHGKRQGEPDRVGDDPGRQEEGSRGDQQSAVEEFVRRHLTRRGLSPELRKGVTPLRANQEHPDKAGEHHE